MGTDLNNFNLINVFNGNILDNVLRILIILLEAVYLIFSFIVTRQVKLMNQSFTTKLAPAYTIFAVIHFFAALIITIISIIAF